jgi:hypothetical protein
MSSHPLQAPTPRLPGTGIRLAVFFLLWLIAGGVCYRNFVTDACPPELRNREAVIHGLLSPLSLAATSSSAPCVPSAGLRPYVGLGFILVWLLSAILMFRARILTLFAISIAVLIGLCLVGGRCLIYMNNHGYS